MDNKNAGLSMLRKYMCKFRKTRPIYFDQIEMRTSKHDKTKNVLSEIYLNEPSVIILLDYNVHLF